MPDRELAELARQLVAIDSINPEFGGPGETEVAQFTATWFERAGLEVERTEVEPGRPNVVGIARGVGTGRTLLLNAHMDTVGVTGMDNPGPRIEGNRLYGRGSYDMKASLAAIMLVGAAAASESLPGDVLVTAVSDEEVGSVGTEALLGSHQADGAIVTEPTELDVAIAHRGFVGFEIETRGRAAHGSRPDLGEDAIRKMGPILLALDELDKHLQAGEAHPLVGTGSLHASLIEGGQEFSSYPERCLLTGERRTLPGETPAEVEQELREAAGNAVLRLGISRQPFALEGDEELVRVVQRLAGTKLVGVPFWTDAALLAEAGIPTLVFGPAGDGAHALTEWVDLDSVARCRDVLLAVAREFCTASS